MYKLLIVDDERIIRDGIVSNIDFVTLGFELVGCCENGIEALDVVNEKKPDVVLTDINMPYMNGIELAEHINAINPLTKVIVLTGFDRFEYVQKAIKLKVFDFLVKPILPRDLTKVFERVIEVLDIENHTTASMKLMKEQISESRLIVRERFYNRLVLGKIKEEDLANNKDLLDFEASNASYITMLCDVLESERASSTYEELDELNSYIMSIAEKALENVTSGISFINYEDQVTIILGNQDDEELMEEAEVVAVRIAEAVDIHIHKKVQIGIGTIEYTVINVSKSYEGAKKALGYRFFDTECEVINYRDIANTSSVDTQLFNQRDTANIYRLLKTGSKSELIEELNNVFDNYRQLGGNIDSYYINIHNILTMVFYALEEINIDFKGIFEASENPFKKLYRFSSLDSIQAWMVELFNQITTVTIQEKKNRNMNQGLKAREYIETYYADPELNLKRICKDLLMSTSYFSSMFKKSFHVTFVEYLTTYRMEKAKEFLRYSDMKTYEVSEKVGYNDPHYFSMVFKKKTGMTTTTFREQIIK